VVAPFQTGPGGVIFTAESRENKRQTGVGIATCFGGEPYEGCRQLWRAAVV